ncbi:MAG: phosphoribosylamine--glycine ligase [Thermoplasmatales archaeon]
MKALLIGGGGREHALGLSIIRSGNELFVISHNRNPGLDRIAKRIFIGNENDREWVLAVANKVQPDYVFIGSENPLAAGVSDMLSKNNFKVFAPSSTAAKLETSKSFCRIFLEEKKIKGNVESRSFSDVHKVEEFIRNLDYDFVIKPDGLTGGKGVLVQGVHFSGKEDGAKLAKAYIGKEGKTVLIERKMIGEEFSLQAFAYGEDIFFLPPVQDYKRAMEGDVGPNTGGMGSICFSTRGLPFIGDNIESEAKHILRSIVSSLNDDGIKYVGPIYGGFIATSEGAKLLEINARLGDPEAINALTLMDNSIFDIAVDMFNGIKPALEFRNKINVLRYVVPKGYGSDPHPSKISVDEERVYLKGLKIFYASVSKRGNVLHQTNSRSLAIYSEGDDLGEVVKRFDGVEDHIKGEYFMRRDIGKVEEIERKKIFMDNLNSRKD